MVISYIKEFILPRVSYKENVQFDAAFPVTRVGLGALRLLAIVPDVDDPTDRTQVYREDDIDLEFLESLLRKERYETAERYVLSVLFGLVREYELHEMKEWFRVDDEPWVEPHPITEV